MRFNVKRIQMTSSTSAFCVTFNWWPNTTAHHCIDDCEQRTYTLQLHILCFIYDEVTITTMYKCFCYWRVRTLHSIQWGVSCSDDSNSAVLHRYYSKWMKATKRAQTNVRTFIIAKYLCAIILPQRYFQSSHHWQPTVNNGHCCWTGNIFLFIR